VPATTEPIGDALASVWRIVAAAEHLGARHTDTGARLVGHVPHIAPEAYLHVIFAPLADAEIDTLEAAVARPLPAVYRRLLGVCNGLSLFAGSLIVYGVRAASVRAGDAAWQPFSAGTANVAERPAGIPGDAVVVASYKKDGSKVYIRADGGVVRCRRDDGVTLDAWPEFLAMLAGEATRIAQHFDAQGRRSNGGLGAAPPRTPSIAEGAAAGS
jgi:hypothetical protein